MYLQLEQQLTIIGFVMAEISNLNQQAHSVSLFANIQYPKSTDKHQ